MTTPRDYGDQYPSDQDDQPPGDPTSGYQETDYDVTGVRRSSHQAPFLSPIAPDPSPEPVYERGIRTWFAILLERIEYGDPNFVEAYPVDQYWVLRQDGKRVAAYNATEETISEYFKTGDDVVIRKDNNGPHDDEAIFGWIIVGKEQPREYPVLDLALSSDTNCTAYSFIIPYSQTVEQLPPDHENAFGTYQDITLKKAGEVKVECDGEALFHIEFSATITLCNPTSDGLDRIIVQHGCWYNAQLSYVGAISTPKLWFALQNGFKVLWDPRDCTANVSIGSYKAPDMILNQQYPEPYGMAFWTQDPRFGGDVYIGTQRGTGYAKIGNPFQYVWLTHGGRGKKLKFRFPAGPPSSTPAFLMAASSKGECVQTAWMATGGTGTIRALGCEVYWEYCYIYADDQQSYQYCAIPTYECQEWKVCQGLVVSGQGIDSNPFDDPCEFFGSQWPAHCPTNQKVDDDPCQFGW